METHVRVLAILYIVFSIIGLLIAVGILLFSGGLAAMMSMQGDPDAGAAAPILGGIGGFIALAAAVFSLPGLFAGIGLMRFRPWARILAIVLSALNLLNVPFGTALAIYGFWVLLSSDAERLFRPPALPVPRQY